MWHFVLLRCVEDNNRLTVKIINNDYDNNLNCSFPNRLKESGAVYYVKSDAVSLSSNSKYYNLKNKSYIQMLNNWPESVPIYVEHLCTICLERRSSVLLNCGHLILCEQCLEKIVRKTKFCDQCEDKHVRCPICRADYKKHFLLEDPSN